MGGRAQPRFPVQAQEKTRYSAAIGAATVGLGRRAWRGGDQPVGACANAAPNTASEVSVPRPAREGEVRPPNATTIKSNVVWCFFERERLVGTTTSERTPFSAKHQKGTAFHRQRARGTPGR